MAKFNLLPKNDAYFDDFTTISGLVHEIVRVMYDAAQQETLPTDLPARVKTLEHEADKVVSRCLNRLDTSFITPIEREDIHLLIVTIDDVGDMLDEAASQMEICQIDKPNEALRSMLGKMLEMTEHISAAAGKLRTLKPALIHEHTRRIRELEHEMDDLHRAALRELFSWRPEAYELVRWKEVYDDVEEAADHGRLVARTIDHILLRHS